MLKRERSRSPIGNSNGEEDSRDSVKRMERKKVDRSRGSGKKVPSDCRVYVSNIPYEFKWQDLKDLFRNEAGDVAYVEMFNDDAGRPRGCAIVDFETAEMAQKAIDKMHRYEVKGRKLIVKEKDEIMHSREFNFLFQDGRDRGRFSRELDRGFDRQFSNMRDVNKFGNTYGLSIPFLESLGINGPLVRKVFVANLDYKVTEDDLREVFKVAGKVTDSEVIKDQDGKSRGFGVVEYEHPVQAVQAISMLHNQVYHDRKISVRLDRATDKQEGGRGASKLPPGLKGLGMGLGINGEAIMEVNNFSYSSAASNSSQMNNMPMGGGMMNMPSNMMDNPPNNMNSQNLMGIGGMSNSNNPLAAAGLGGVNPNLAAAALGLGVSQSMLGLSQNLSSAMGGTNAFSNPSSGMGMNSGGGSGNNDGGMGFGNVGQSSNNFGQRSVVQITNLPLDYTWQSLKDLCRDYGEIRFAEMRSKGVGLVRFASEQSARKAVDMLDRQRFDGRHLDAMLL